MDQNYTDISDLVKNAPSPFLSYGSPEHQEHFPKQEQEEIQDNEMAEVVEHEPEPEVQKVVQARKETIEVPPDLQAMGVTSQGTPMFPTFKKEKLPLTDEKIMYGLHAPITSSIRWLAEICKYLLKQAHIGIKNIHGKVTRVISR